MSPFQNQLLLASAGTGKTYRLTTQFLGLLLAGVEPDRILATTFTRKAAGEILDRVLERLVDALDSKEGLDRLRQALDQPGLGDLECRTLLAKLTRNLDTFQVRTIDSFFVHLVRLFALDLELPPNWSISDVREDEALRADAMQAVLEKANRQEMLELLRDLQKGGAASGVQRALLSRTERLRPIALECAPDAWDSLSPMEAPSQAAFVEACQALRRAPLAQTAQGKDNANWTKARKSILDSIDKGTWASILQGGFFSASLSSKPTYYKKELSRELLDALAPIFLRAKAELLDEQIARNAAVHSLLDRFETHYTEQKRRGGLYGFDDLPQALAPRTSRAQLFDEREAELWFRLDGQLDHLLLDEFQDTSPVQWRILAPLAGEIISSPGEARSFFCVGDAKQSIYGFRQAEPRLLMSLPELLPGLVAEHMDKSYRSSKVVLDMVNLVFGDIERNASLTGNGLEPHLEAAKAWSRGFESHASAKDLAGVVHVLEAEAPDPKESKSQPLIRCTVARVAKILREAPQAEIGVLTGTNKNIPALIHALRQEGIDASGEGGNALTDSVAVLVYISILHLADHPSDSAAAFHIKSSPFSAFIGLPIDASAEAVSAKAREIRAQLLHRGLGQFTAELNQFVQGNPEWSLWDQARFAQLADQANAFAPQLSLRSSDFIDHLRSHRVEAPGGSRVRVMTVHASKGLEFDAVVLGELDKNLVGQRDNFLTDRPDPTGLIRTALLSPGKNLLMLSPKLKELYDLTTEKAVCNSLCMLYVAMTRARFHLELILPKPAPKKSKSNDKAPAPAPTFASLIRAVLPSDECLKDDPDGILWSSPNNAEPSSWAKDLKEPKEPRAQPGRELQLAPTTTLRTTPRRSASSGAFGSQVSTTDLLRPQTGAQVGSLVHAAFESCQWIEDFTFEPSMLQDKSAPAPLVASARSVIEGALASQEIRQALSQKACRAPQGAQLQVTCEYRFSTLLEDPTHGSELCSGAIDRLTLARKDEQVIWAEILDYKTDQATEQDLPTLAEHHRPQLETYAQVIATQYNLPPSQIHLRLAFLSIGRIVDLTN